MNRDEAKTILLLYHPGTVDEADPQIAEALALAKSDPVLRDWLAEHEARQNALRAKFQEITVPEGLKEQIISEQAAARRRTLTRRNAVLALALVTGMIALAAWWFSGRPGDDTFAIYRQRMVSSALRGYAMDLATNNPAEIRSYLARNQAPADYVLPVALAKAEITGCTIQNWQGAKVSMICFRANASCRVLFRQETPSTRSRALESAGSKRRRQNCDSGNHHHQFNQRKSGGSRTLCAR